MRMLERNATVTTRLRRRLRREHRQGSPAAARSDWFYYVNGVQAGKGAADTKLHSGDHVWWDRHDWSATQSIPAVVGSFPEPFPDGYGGKRLPLMIECTQTAAKTCREVQNEFSGLKLVASLSCLLCSEYNESLPVLVGPYATLTSAPAALKLAGPVSSSGVYARFEDGGRRLALLDQNGHVVRTAGAGAGLVAATRYRGQPPTWFVTGTDAGRRRRGGPGLQRADARRPLRGGGRRRRRDPAARQRAVSYLRRASPLHAARASAAGLYCAALVTAAFITAHPLVLAVLVAHRRSRPAMACGAGGRVMRSLWLSAPMGVAIIVVNALVTREGLTVLARLGDGGPLGQLDITARGARLRRQGGARAVVIVAVAALASAAIDPDEVLRSMRRVSFRSALTATIATRMVPLLALDARRIGDAQRCRPQPAGRLAVMRAITANALDRSLDVAATLEVRGYGSARRPARSRRPASRHDLAFAASAVAIVVLAAAWPAPFSYYPTIHGSFGASALAHAGALAVAALAPFAQRRGIAR